MESDMTTNEAADYLNVSRPYLIKLLNLGQLPFHKVGTHKRVYFQDIKRYKEEQRARSYALLAELQAEAQELNMGY
jgi:excisionase family DNA binding protein